MLYASDTGGHVLASHFIGCCTQSTHEIGCAHSVGAILCDCVGCCYLVSEIFSILEDDVGAGIVDSRP